MWVMYDAVNTNEIPHSAQAVAGYVGGRWPTYYQLPRQFPHIPAERIISIAIAPNQVADCLDIENGDAQPRDAPAWVLRQKRRGLERPILYASLDTLPAITIALDAARITRPEYRLWSADYTHQPHITPGADATQWTDQAQDRQLDETLANDDFFTQPSHAEPELGHTHVILPRDELTRMHAQATDLALSLGKALR